MVGQTREGDLLTVEPVSVYVEPQYGVPLQGRSICYRTRVEGYRAPEDGTLVTPGLKLDYDPFVEDRLELYDYRRDRVWGAPARVIVQQKPSGRGSFELIRLEHTLIRSEPVASLFVAHYDAGWGTSGGILDNSSRWSRHLTIRTRSGKLTGGRVVALVDDDHRLVLQQDHVAVGYGLNTEAADGTLSSLPTGNISIVAHYRGRREDLLEEAAEQGYPAIITASDTVVAFRPAPLPVGGHGGSDGRKFAEWMLPGGFPMPDRVDLEASESGGGFLEAGRSCVVADMNFAPLRPFNIGRDPKPCAHMGRFASTEGLITITVNMEGSEGDAAVAMTLYHLAAVEMSGRQPVVRLYSEELWQGGYFELPDDFGFGIEAINAAVKKAACRHCVCRHYSTH